MPVTELQVSNAARRAGLGEQPGVHILKRENDVALIDAGGDTYYLKTYTKPWYGGDIAATGGCVAHESEAWRTLAAAGLAVPELVAADTGVANPLGRPYLITRALPGRSLTELLRSSDPRVFEGTLFSTGQYLARMHAITYRYAGYIMPGEPSAPPDPDAWQHPIWKVDVLQREAEQTWQADEHQCGAALLDDVRAFAARHWAALTAEYAPPRFVHGDCHAHQFFLEPDGDAWHVTGVLDLEVASSGDRGADWLKLGLELPGHLRDGRHWWEPLFAGYGSAPPFDTLRLRFLAAAQINYSCYGDYAWPGSRADILRRVLNAYDWSTLFMNPGSG